MRKPNQITIDRAMLLYLLELGEAHGVGSDVKLQQIAFLAELQLFGKRLKGLHFEFFRFAYGAFSKDLDNDLTSLRRRERVENFSLTDLTIPLKLGRMTGTMKRISLIPIEVVSTGA